MIGEDTMIMVKKNGNTIKRMIIKIGITVLFLLTFLTPDFEYFPKYTWILSLMGVSACINKKFLKHIGFFKQRNVNFVILLLISMAYLFVQPFLHMTFDFSYISLLVGMILSFFRNLLLVYVIYKYDNSDDALFNKFCDFLIYACCVCVFFTVLFIVIPSFKNFWVYHILKDQSEITYYKYKYRFNIAGFAAFNSSSLFAIVAILAGYRIANEKKFSFSRIFTYFIISLGCFFYGRVALIGVFLGAVIVVLETGRRSKICKMLLLVSIIIIFGGVLLQYLATISNDFLVWKNWAFGIFEQIFTDRKVSDYSVTRMNEMWFLPEFKTLVVGDGLYTDPITGRYYKSVDLGYLRLVLYGGAIGVILAFVPAFYMILSPLKHSMDKNRQKLFCTVLLCWLILEIKGGMYHRLIMIVYPLFLATLHQDGNNKMGKKLDDKNKLLSNSKYLQVAEKSKM